MVHALNEIHRVLRPDGFLIDLRPLLDQWPIEVAWSGGHLEAGRVTDLDEPVGDDAAASAAMTEITAAGAFQREIEDAFSVFYYWDTPVEMEQYLAEDWSDVITVNDAVWKDLRASWSTANAEARVRLRMRLLITRYRKRD